MWKSGVCILTLVVMLLAIVTKAARGKGGGRGRGKHTDDDDELKAMMKRNISALWSEVHDLQNIAESGVNLHVHGADDAHIEHDNDDHDDHDGDGKHVHVHMHLEMKCPMKHMMGMGMGKPGHHGRPHKPGHGGHGGHHGHHGMADEDDDDDDEHIMNAHCQMVGNPAVAESDRSGIAGPIHLRQRYGGPLEVQMHLTGFDPSTHHHGFHVHEFGDMSDGCNKGLGGHYNPSGSAHGGKDAAERHAGDWGNIECDSNGDVTTEFNDTMSTLHGYQSMVGRSIVIHERHDDFGMGESEASRNSGDAGIRLACCVIGWADAGVHTHH